jgi:hypothetical protein
MYPPAEVGSTAIHRLPLQSSRVRIDGLSLRQMMCPLNMGLAVFFDNPGKGPCAVTMGYFHIGHGIGKGDIDFPLPHHFHVLVKGVREKPV